MLMFSLLKQIKPNEHTKKSAKLTQQMKKYLRSIYKARSTYHDKLAHEAEDVWTSAKQEILKEVGEQEYVVSLRATLMALYGLLEHIGYQNLCFTERTFESTMNSIEAVGYTNHDADDLQVEQWSNKLIDLFADSLDIKKDNKLKLMKARVAGNLLLSGKLRKEFT